MSQTVATGTKQVQEDGVNGLPVRDVDSSGNTPVQAVRMQLFSMTNLQANTSGTAQTVAAYTEILVTVNITSVSGTTPSLTLYIELSDDGGTTWYTKVYQIGAALTAAGQATLTIAAPAGKAFGDTIRLGAYVTGTYTAGQGFTGTVNAIGK